MDEYVKLGDVTVEVFVTRKGLNEKIPVDRKEQDLLTTNGRDLVHAALLYASSQGAGFSYYAVTSNASFSPAVGDTTFSNEITASGMARHQLVNSGESISHSNGTNSTVATAIFTNNGTGSVTVYGYANFTTSGATQPVFEQAVSGTTLQVGDSLTLVITYTIG